MMEPVADESTPERIWAGDFDGQGFGHCVAGMQGGLYEEYVLASRLSDAEARIAELEALATDENKGLWRFWNAKAEILSEAVTTLKKAKDEAEARAEAAEAAIEQMKADHACEVADMATRFRSVNVERLSEQLGADIFALRDRATAAEALLKRLKTVGGAMANACYNIGQRRELSTHDRNDLLMAQVRWDEAVQALRAARAIHDKIGVKDE